MSYVITSCCLSLALLAVAVQSALLKPRIANGEAADITDYPYQVSLRLRGKHICGGSIISGRHVLTAAHCVDGVTAKYPRLLRYLTVNTGSSLSSGDDGKSYAVEKLAIHEGWTGEKEDAYKNDIAVVTLTEAIAFDDRTRKIDLPSRDAKVEEWAVVTGWGSNKWGSEIAMAKLQRASMRTVMREECQKLIPLRLSSGSVYAYYAKGVGICNGDSGGPLAIDNELVGIVSFSIACALSYPDVYTNVYYYKDWILEKMKD